MGSCAAIGLTLDWAASRSLLTQRHGDGTNLGVHAGSKYNTASPPFGDRGGTECNVQAIPRTSILVIYGVRVFGDWKRFASEKSFIGFKVDSFNESVPLLVCSCAIVRV
jgi:hypothetical protein